MVFELEGAVLSYTPTHIVMNTHPVVSLNKNMSFANTDECPPICIRARNSNWSEIKERATRVATIKYK